MTIKTIIVEDENPHVETLLRDLKHFPEIEVVEICSSVKEGKEKIQALKPQLVFLDVNLTDGSCFDLLDLLQPIEFKVIFTTASDRHAKTAFRYAALDYLEKPFGISLLKEAIERFKISASVNEKKNYDVLLDNSKQTDISKLKLAIHVLGGMDFIPVSEIIMCQSDSNYTDFYLKGNKKFTATKPLRWVNDRLNEPHFYRVHASYLINTACMISYRTKHEGAVVSLFEGHEAEVARNRRPEFLAFIEKQGIPHS